jgi:hypothetical protein
MLFYEDACVLDLFVANLEIRDFKIFFYINSLVDKLFRKWKMID